MANILKTVLLVTLTSCLANGQLVPFWIAGNCVIVRVWRRGQYENYRPGT